MLIAQIAFDQLNKQGDSKLADLLITMMNAFKNKDIFTDYLESACWADNLRTDGGMNFMRNQHFVDTPLNPFNISIPLIDANNITFALVIN